MSTSDRDNLGLRVRPQSLFDPVVMIKLNAKKLGDGGVWIILVVSDEHEFALVDDRKNTRVDVFSFQPLI